jgi:hypothetical protein
MVIKMRKRQKLGLWSVKMNSDAQKIRRDIKLEKRRKIKEEWCNPINFYSLRGCKLMFKGYKTDEQIQARYKKFKAKRPA